MIVYSSTKSQFQADIMTNDIGAIILNAYTTRTGRSTAPAEVDSWTSSLSYMDKVLSDAEIPDDAGAAIEFHIPQTSKRIDFILTGKDHEQQDTAILVELKQWQYAKLTDQDAIVITRFKQGEKETPHPCYQAWSYNQTVQDERNTL